VKLLNKLARIKPKDINEVLKPEINESKIEELENEGTLETGRKLTENEGNTQGEKDARQIYKKSKLGLNTCINKLTRQFDIIFNDSKIDNLKTELIILFSTGKDFKRARIKEAKSIEFKTV
jgi:hypothetical protein